MLNMISEVAFHEAGHAVMASIRGFNLVRVSIRWNTQEQRWDGATERPPSQYTLMGSENGQMYCDISGPLNEIAIACAGFLAQARHVAGDEAQFGIDHDWDSLLLWMADRHPETQSVFPLSLATRSAETPRLVHVQPRWFGGIDRTVYLHQRDLIEGPPFGNTTNNHVKDAILEVMTQFDQDPVWTKVSTVANALISCCDGVSATLDDSQCAEALKT